MFEQLTDQARRVVVLAQEEAWLLHHDYISTEHLLLGLIHEGDNPAAAMLGGSGVTLEVARAAVEDVVGRGEHAPETSHIPFASGAKTVLELAWREASHSGGGRYSAGCAEGRSRGAAMVRSSTENR